MHNIDNYINKQLNFINKLNLKKQTLTLNKHKITSFLGSYDLIKTPIDKIKSIKKATKPFYKSISFFTINKKKNMKLSEINNSKISNLLTLNPSNHFDKIIINSLKKISKINKILPMASKNKIKEAKTDIQKNYKQMVKELNKIINKEKKALFELYKIKGFLTLEKSNINTDKKNNKKNRNNIMKIINTPTRSSMTLASK